MHNFLYREVFIVGVDNTVVSEGELEVCESFEDLLIYLRRKNAVIDNDIRVIHGVITPATAIPKDLKNKNIFILIIDPTDKRKAIIRDADSEDDFSEVAEEIESMLSSEEIAGFIFEIEDMYIIYGHELTLTLSVDEDDLDDEIIASCLEIAEAAKDLIKVKDD